MSEGVASGRGDMWLILRTASRSTIHLAESLVEDGYEAWTPIETIDPESPKEKAARRRHRVNPEGLAIRPLLPSFVFAKAKHERELLALSHSPTLTYRYWDPEKRRMVIKGHAFFRLFHDGLGVSKVPDGALSSLVEIAEHSLDVARRRRKPRGTMPTWAVGDRVKLTEGCFAGLSGEVVELLGKKGKEVKVTFPGWPQAATFSAWALVPET